MTDNRTKEGGGYTFATPSDKPGKTFSVIMECSHIDLHDDEAEQEEENDDK